MEPSKKPSQKRAEYDKVGKYKYILRRFNEVHEDIKALIITQRYMIKGLEHEFLFDKKYVEDAACKDEFDREILWELRGAGVDGLLPRDISKRLGSRKVTAWKVTQRIRHLNDRLDQLIGQTAAEKRGMNWALTSFMKEAWGSTKEEMEKEEFGS